MRAMQSPWGVTLVVITAVLGELFLFAATAALFALASFLVRKSRSPTQPVAARS
jgi:hypothetical protein